MTVDERGAAGRLAGAALALGLVTVQFLAIRYAPSGAVVRLVLPLTVAAVPLALWSYRDYVGVSVMFVGVAANLAVIVANGGLMPMERRHLVEAIGAERAAGHEVGAWIPGSKDVLVGPGGGRLTALGDSIVVRVGRGGMVASAGDVVIAAGLAVVAAEAALGRPRRTRQQGVAAADAEAGAEQRAAA